MFSEDYLQESDIKAIEEYVTSPQKRMYLVHPTIYMGIQSRGTGKSTVLQALRSLRIGNMDVPRSVNVFYGANYAGLQLRTMPGTIAGWIRFGLREGRDFVINNAPPRSWPRPYGYETPLSYKNTISTRWGSIFILGSNDRPGMVNSLSITGHVGIDEFRFINDERMVQDLFPAMRGNLALWGGDNPHNMSMTLTSDRPFPGESEFYKDYQKMMSLEQVYRIMELSLVHEQKAYEIYGLKQQLASHEHDLRQKQEIRAELSAKHKELGRLAKSLRFIRGHWYGKDGRIEKKASVFFDTASVFSNAHILTLDYIRRNADDRVMKKPVFRTSMLNLEPEQVEAPFYGAWSPRKHVINGNWDYSTLDEIGIVNPEKPEAFFKAALLLDYDPRAEVDIELDFGDLVTCSVSQTLEMAEGLTELYIGTFEVSQPQTVDSLIDKVNSFLLGHVNRTVNLYVDPSGHYQMDRERLLTYVAKTKKRLGHHHWTYTEHLPKGSTNSLHDIKHTTVNDILREENFLLPKVRVVRETNKALINSIQLTEYKLDVDRKGVKRIYKDKSSEKKISLTDKQDGNTTDHGDHFDIKLQTKYGHLIEARRSGYDPAFL